MTLIAFFQRSRIFEHREQQQAVEDFHSSLFTAPVAVAPMPAQYLVQAAQHLP